MNVEIQKEHGWLQKLVGEWTYEAACSMGPGQEEMKTTGSDVVRLLGGLWVLCEAQGEMPGAGPCSSVMTIGYDPQKKRFVGTFIASMMTHLWHYDGELDAAANRLALYAEGPDMAVEGKFAKYKDVIELKNDDRRTLTSYVFGDDGQWHQIMTAHYRRRE